MSYYPVFLNLEDKSCVVIGGGAVAERKILALLDTGASVRVISPDVTGKIAALGAGGTIKHEARVYRDGDLKGAFLVIAATSDMEVNRKVFQEAGDVPVNVVDVPELCSFIVPSVIKRGPLVIAISTSGVSPALSKTIREELEGLYCEELEQVLDFMENVRKRIKDKGMDSDRRAEIFKKIGSRETLKILRNSGPGGVKDFIRMILRRERIEL
ncbi:siroheme synthase [bacterium BMS3Bbin06]|nr:siroheme synthase [bacterium BMS3Abin08]GBE34604.1 siroheme synthase [bacterium BMS3Bbin06]HDO35686.1 bifunctional precorrin-2 dehydrogenase/sirohydrochlorin ferrochelatase [Nitrospirota bacterium]HDY70935.1 bifunctional precorrin-2 dehydrogenase/sirohydrochlorin ferrochelatase [Nitrospirota bacterium]